MPSRAASLSGTLTVATHLILSQGSAPSMGHQHFDAKVPALEAPAGLDFQDDSIGEALTRSALPRRKHRCRAGR